MDSIQYQQNRDHSMVSPYVIGMNQDSELDDFAEKLEQERLYTQENMTPVNNPYEVQIFDQDYAKSNQKNMPSLQKQM